MADRNITTLSRRGLLAAAAILPAATVLQALPTAAEAATGPTPLAVALEQHRCARERCDAQWAILSAADEHMEPFAEAVEEAEEAAKAPRSTAQGRSPIAGGKRQLAGG